MADVTFGSTRSPIRQSRSRPTPSSGSRRRGLCGSDLHLYEVIGAVHDEGDILGHEPMGIVEEVGAAVTHIAPGDRGRGPVQHLVRALLHVRARAAVAVRDDAGARARTRAPRCSATPSSTARCRAAQAELLRVPAGAVRADQGARGPARRPLRLPVRRAADRVAGRRVRGDPRRRHAWSSSASDRSVTMACRVAQPPGRGRVIGVDLVPERLERAPRRTASTSSTSPRSTTTRRGRSATLHRRSGPTRSSTRSAWRRTARRSAKLAQQRGRAAARRRRREADAARPASTGSPRCTLAIDLVRRGGTISLSGVYGGMTDPMPMMVLFDKQIQLRMGQANVKRWIDDILPLADRTTTRSGVDDFATHHLPLEDAPRPTRCSRRSRTARSRSCSSRPDRIAGGGSAAGRAVRTDALR